MKLDIIHTLSQYITRPIIVRFAKLCTIYAEYCAIMRKRRVNGLYWIIPAKTGHYSDMLNRVRVAYSDKYGRFYYNKTDNNTIINKRQIKFIFKYSSIIYCNTDRYNISQNQGSKTSDYLNYAHFRTVTIARNNLNYHLFKNNIQITLEVENINYIFIIEDMKFKSMNCTISTKYKNVNISYKYTIAY